MGDEKQILSLIPSNKFNLTNYNISKKNKRRYSTYVSFRTPCSVFPLNYYMYLTFGRRRTLRYYNTSHDYGFVPENLPP